MPALPTIAESGLPGYDYSGWYGVLAPAGTPKPVIDKLAAEIARIVAAPEFREKLEGQGTEAFPSTPEQFANLIKADLGSYAKVVKAANIRLEQ